MRLAFLRRLAGGLFLLGAISFPGLFAPPALAVEPAPVANSARIPVVVATDSPDARSPGGSADRLLQKVSEEGELSVIVGLRFAMHNEARLAPPAIAAQRRALRAVQDTVISRVFGKQPEDAELYTFIPAMALVINGAEAARLIADPSVATIAEDVGGIAFGDNTAEWIHADDVVAKGATGSGRVVAVLDSGVDKNHYALNGKVVSEACYSSNTPAEHKTSFCPGGVDESTAPGSGKFCPLNFTGCNHGTHVASIAAGVNIQNAVATGAKIIAIKIFSRSNRAKDCAPRPAPCAQYQDRDLLKGLQRVLALRTVLKIAAVNLSIGERALFSTQCDDHTPMVAAAIANLRDAGIAPIVAAGNTYSEDAISSPACVSSAIAIANTDRDDDYIEHVHSGGGAPSSYGNLIKLAAPGTRVDGAVPGDAIGTFTGTSQAAPQVAGAFAILKQARPGASVDDILEALECSGKTVERPEGSGIDKPRIDVLGAYNWLLKAPGAKRAWNFSDTKQALDWTPFLGDWRIQSGIYAPNPIPNGIVFTSTANCNKRLEVTARIRREYPIGGTGDSHVAPNAGIILKSKLDYKNRYISGYFFGYNYLPRWPDEHERGTGFIQRIDVSSQGAILCQESSDVPIVYGGWNTIRAVSDGATQKLYLNDKLICEGTDDTYESGPVAAITGFSTNYPTTGGTFAVNSVSTKSIGTGDLLTGKPRSMQKTVVAGARSAKPSRSPWLISAGLR